MKRLFIVIIATISIFSLYFFMTQKHLDTSKASTILLKQTPLLKGLFAEKGLVWAAPVFIRIFKESKELEVWIQQKESFVLLKTYPIYYFSGTLGPKLKEGDRQAPEGFYHVTENQLNPNSSYHLSFNIGYPNTYDKYHQRTGSLIMVHGSTVSIGCFAMTDPLIEEIYTIVHAAFQAGQKEIDVHVFPFRMTTENLKKHENSKWLRFWKNLRVGYDSFDMNKTVPHISVKDDHYFFE